MCAITLKLPKKSVLQINLTIRRLLMEAFFLFLDFFLVTTLNVVLFVLCCCSCGQFVVALVLFFSCPWSVRPWILVVLTPRSLKLRFFSPPLDSSSVTSRTHMRTHTHCHHQARSRDICLTTDRRIKRLCRRNWTNSVVSCRRYRHLWRHSQLSVATSCKQRLPSHQKSLKKRAPTF